MIFIVLFVKKNSLRLIFAVLGLNRDTFLNLFAKKHIQFARNTLPVNEPGRGIQIFKLEKLGCMSIFPEVNS